MPRRSSRKARSRRQSRPTSRRKRALSRKSSRKTSRKSSRSKARSRRLSRRKPAAKRSSRRRSSSSRKSSRRRNSRSKAQSRKSSRRRQKGGSFAELGQAAHDQQVKKKCGRFATNKCKNCMNEFGMTCKEKEKEEKEKKEKEDKPEKSKCEICIEGAGGVDNPKQYCKHSNPAVNCETACKGGECVEIQNKVFEQEKEIQEERQEKDLESQRNFYKKQETRKREGRLRGHHYNKRY
tara:strand:+ start:182 stop:892 length:711 start_codon:yes stop_codon:yes gene_type:complete